MEYNTRTHHSNMDVYERIQEDDMRKNAVIVASFVYHTANRDQKLPRKPLPKPQPALGGGAARAAGGSRAQGSGLRAQGSGLRAQGRLKRANQHGPA